MEVDNCEDNQIIQKLRQVRNRHKYPYNWGPIEKTNPRPHNPVQRFTPLSQNPAPQFSQSLTMETEKKKIREQFIFIAKLAEQAERYDEMVEAMKGVARLDVELTAEERTLLSVGYQKTAGSRRASRRILAALLLNEEGKGGSEVHAARIRGFMARIDEEVSKICNEVLSIIAIHLLPASAAGESIVFFYKMKGDYYRYLAEFKTDNEQKEAADQALMAYQAATSTAMTDLRPTHPVRLGLALNFSVFYYEILKSPDRACYLAKQAFEEAIRDLSSPNEEPSKDTTLIMQLLNDNLTLWTSELPDGGEQYKPADIDMDD